MDQEKSKNLLNSFTEFKVVAAIERPRSSGDVIWQGTCPWCLEESKFTIYWVHIYQRLLCEKCRNEVMWDTKNIYERTIKKSI
jgi:hypothetical protein